MSASGHHWSFRALLFLQGILVAAAPLVVVLLVGALYVVPELDDDIRRQQRATTQAAAAQVAGHLASARREMQSAAALIGSVGAGSIGNGADRQAELDRILDALVGSGTLYEAIYLAGRDGIVTSLGLPALRRGARPDLRGIDLSRREFVGQALRSGEAVWSPSFLSAVSGRLVVALTLPVQGGILVAEMSLGQFSYFLREQAANTKAVALLVDRRGYVIAHPRPEQAGQQVSLSDQPLVGEAFTRGGAIGRLDFDGQHMVGAAQAISGIDWAILVAQPVGSAFRLVDIAVLAMLAGLTAAIVLSLFAAFWLAAASAARLRAFADNAGALAAGRFDLAWPKTRIAEFLRLGEGLRLMAEAIQAREAAILQGEARYREVVESSADLITRVDAEGRFRFVNKAAERVFGLPAEQCIGRLAFDFVHPDDRATTQESFVRWLASKAETTRFENRQVGVDGRVFSIVWSIHAHRNAEGEVVEFSSIGHDLTEYRRAEGEIRRLALVASSTSNAVLITDAEGRVEWVNVACEHLTGFSLAELKGDWPWRLRVRGETEGELLDWMIGELAQGRGFKDIELRTTRKDGELRWHEVEAQPVRDARGRVIQFVIIESDVSERRLAQDSLRVSEERLRATLESTPNVAVQWYEADGTITFWNKSSERIFGVAAADVLGRRVGEVVGPMLGSPGNDSFFTDVVAEIEASGKAVGPYESQIRRADGKVAWILSTTFAIPGATGGRIYVCMDVDISEEKALVEALKASEQKFLAVFQSSPVPVVVSRLDAGVVLIDCNAAWERKFGFAREEVVGRTGLDFGFWNDPAERASMLTTLAAKNRVEDREVVLRRSDGETLVCLASGQAVTLGDERLAIVAYRDVTKERRDEQALRELNASLEHRVEERTAALAAAVDELRGALETLQRAQDELIRSEKLAALGSLVAGIAHELNTPIGNGLMAASTLDDHTEEFARVVESGQVRRSALEQFVRDARTAAAIVVRNLRKASELVSSFKQVAVDQTSAQRREFTLDELLAEIVLTLRPSFKKTPYTVDYQVSADLRLDSYPGPLGQILTNLINNALIHAFEGRESGTVRITATAEGQERIRIEVTDDGRGIDPAHLPRIFDPFFTTRLGKGGSGLGLHIVHNIATRVLGGSVKVESSPAGTRFVISIPRRAPIKSADDAR